MGRRARNPRRTTRAEPARNADARNPRVLLILLVLVVVVVAVVVVVGEAGGQDGTKMHCIALVMKQKLPCLYGITVWDLRPLLSCCWGYYSLGLFKLWWDFAWATIEPQGSWLDECLVAPIANPCGNWAGTGSEMLGAIPRIPVTSQTGTMPCKGLAQCRTMMHNVKICHVQLWHWTYGRKYRVAGPRSLEAFWCQGHSTLDILGSDKASNPATSDSGGSPAGQQSWSRAQFRTKPMLHFEMRRGSVLQVENSEGDL